MLWSLMGRAHTPLDTGSPPLSMCPQGRAGIHCSWVPCRCPQDIRAQLQSTVRCGVIALLCRRSSNLHCAANTTAGT